MTLRLIKNPFIMKLAALIQPEAHQQVNALYQEFLSRPATEQCVLVLLSVIYKAININQLNAVVAMLEQRSVLVKPKSAYRLSEHQYKELAAASLLHIENEQIRINPLLANCLINSLDEAEQLFNFSEYDTHTSKLLSIILAAEDVVPVVTGNHWQSKALADRHRMLRDFYCLQQIDKLVLAMAANKNPQIVDHKLNAALVELLFLPFELEQFLLLPNTVQYQAFATLFFTFQKEGCPCSYPISLLEQVCEAHPGANDSSYNIDCQHLLAEQYLYQLRFDEYKQLALFEGKSSYALQLRAGFCFLSGDINQALDYFQQAIVAKNRLSRRKNQYLNGVFGYFHKLALIAYGNRNNPSYYYQAIEQIEFENADTKVFNPLNSLSQAMLESIQFLSGDTDRITGRSADETKHNSFFADALNRFHYLLAQHWSNGVIDSELINLTSQCQEEFERLDYVLFATLSKQLVYAFTQQSLVHDESLINITSMIESKSSWDLALDKLMALSPKKNATTIDHENTDIGTNRLVWELESNKPHKLIPREQTRNKSTWSKGRVVSLKQLKEQTKSFNYLSESDLRICKAIRAFHGWGYNAKAEYTLEGLSALEAALGIDKLYHQGDLSQTIELVKSEPELMVSEQGGQICLSIPNLPDLTIEEGKEPSAQLTSRLNQGKQNQVYALKRASSRLYQLTVFSEQHLKVAKIVGEGGLLVPISAKQKALDSIAAIAPFLNIQSDLAELDTGLERWDCDHHLVVNIEPVGQGLSFNCVVMPFGEKGPAFKPGLGNTNISTEIGGKRIATLRDLAYEQRLLDQLDQACPMFLGMSDTSLLLNDFQSALQALEELEAARVSPHFDVILRWPKGKKFSVSKTLQSAHLQLALGKKSEWFDISGNLHINDEQVIALRQLLELVKTSNGRFVALGSEQVLALSEDLKNKLEQLNQLSEDGKFHPLAAFQIAEVTAGMRMKTLHAWDQQTLKMREANTVSIKVPSTFKGQLRDYQFAGFEWAMRLAHWGAGACLADDMGLGKTLQALAVILARANKGPSLVIAPTSVCFNWQQEASKFCPTLSVKLFSEAGSIDDRKQLLQNLDSLDCLVLSYGMLQRESELLQSVSWTTIVADEAQALKNPIAKRTKAACALKADFKMVTTGTPIENDLSELWSIFRFVNPGLLGNLKSFSKRFSHPIENAKEEPLKARAASQALRTLTETFILRRMKHDVLSELPPRTNINVAVNMSAEEQAFYEALRLNAIDNISQSSQQGNTGEQRIKMLAELVKLRQACCNVKLVMAESSIPSAKLEALDELLNELKLNNHKALIFSQFVGHLQLIKEHIEARGFSYQYLDGATPQKVRQKAVNNFQSGEGDIFLISLKAGGSGLNLTAADYVIHMDPWWNPAVEDQASDRAHRIGQNRPVTIYRLICQNTIEQKIVALHEHKRDIADTILSGNDSVTKLSVDDMLNMLKDTL